MFNNLQEIIEEARRTPPLTLAVAAAEDSTLLDSVKEAEEQGIVRPLLVGNREKIEKILIELDYDFTGEIVEAADDEEAARKTIELVHTGEADLPMKGLLNTRIILKALLAEEYGLRQGRLLSLVTLLYLEQEKRMTLLTDAGMNIAPDLQAKVEIIENAVEVARSLGIERPGVAVLAAVEKVNPAMPATMEAAVLAKMADRGQIRNAVIDGPLAFDNAISYRSARHKGIESPVAGKADILLVPNIESGNILYKALIFYAGLEAASIVYGAKVPLVITSRADRPEIKFNSIALAKVIQNRARK